MPSGSGPMILSRAASIDELHGARELDHEFVEDRAGEGAPHAGNLFEFGERELGLGQILLGHFAQAFFAEQAQ